MVWWYLHGNTQSLGLAQVSKISQETGGHFLEQIPLNYCLGYFSYLFDQPMKRAGVSEIFLLCLFDVYTCYTSHYRLNRRELFQDTNSTPSYGVTVASIQCHNECLLCAKRRLSWAPVQRNYYPSFSSTAYTGSCRIIVKETKGPGMFISKGTKGMRKWKEKVFVLGRRNWGCLTVPFVQESH